MSSEHLMSALSSTEMASTETTTAQARLLQDNKDRAKLLVMAMLAKLNRESVSYVSTGTDVLGGN